MAREYKITGIQTMGDGEIMPKTNLMKARLQTQYPDILADIGGILPHRTKSPDDPSRTV